MTDQILFELGLIRIFAENLQSEDYKKSLANRKSIYPFIHNMTAFLIDLVNSQIDDIAQEASLRYQLFQKCEDDWKVLCKALEDCEKLFSIEWGEM